MKHIAIVGGSGGLGSAVARKLIDRGEEVVVIGRTKPPDERVRNFYAVDATTADWSSIYSAIESQTGGLEAVIFVAGTAAFGKTTMIPMAQARQTFELNFWALASAARAAAEFWDNRNQAGKFVAILSIVARRAVPFEAYYAASKAASARFLECLQFEYSHKNIEFVTAFPGMLKTPFRHQANWYGFKPNGVGEGADVQRTAEAVIGLLEGKRKARVIGWRERSIDFADRVFPGLYDRTVLRARVQKSLK
ncbi:MAG TPA: SDR family NAD(P)-dependent oxidoreductase [Terriglobales bacterium]|nr:SDR family NAD(P)-dependent oxidoreductase [Terriglobales bacterium]